MPRIRTLKPDFWSDKRMVKLSPYARLFYMGMWNFALCDRGHLPDDAEELKLKILPVDPVDADALLSELIDAGRIRRCATPDGDTYLWVWKLGQHQKVDGRWQPRCPYCALEKSAKPRQNSREDAGEASNSPQSTEPEDDDRAADDFGAAEASAKPRRNSREFGGVTANPTEPPSASPELPREGKEGREGKGREGSSGTGTARASGGWTADLGEPPHNDPPGPAERIVSDWLAALPNGRTQPAVVDAIARHVADALRVGTDDATVAEALRLWQTRGNLGPNVLPSLIHQLATAVPDDAPPGEVVPLHQARRDPRPSTKDNRVADHMALVAELEAEEARS